MDTGEHFIIITQLDLDIMGSESEEGFSPEEHECATYLRYVDISCAQMDLMIIDRLKNDQTIWGFILFTAS